MNSSFTPELIKKARAAKSVGELFTLAKENSIEMTEEEAKTIFDRLNLSGELSDDELDSVAGGGCNSGKCVLCGHKMKMDMKYCLDRCYNPECLAYKNYLRMNELYGEDNW